MRKAAGAIVLLVAVAIVVWLVADQALNRKPKTPDGVVLLSFDCLRAADFKKLKSCYSDEAWAIVEGSLPSPSDTQAIVKLGEYMDGLREIRIQATESSGKETEVTVILDHADGEVRETFRLIKSGRSWVID